MDKVIELAKQAGIPFNKYDLIGCDSCERDIDGELHAFYTLARADLEAENAKLQKANKMLDTALCRAYPYGCYNGDVAYLWNAARASLGDK